MKSQLFAQRDFSGGQVNNAARRRDDIDSVRTGAKTQLNWRIEQTNQLVPRPGRRPIFASRTGGVRTEPIRMGVGLDYLLTFAPQSLVITDLAGNVVSGNGGLSYGWTTSTIDNIQICRPPNQVLMTFPGFQPQLINWDPSSGLFSYSPFVFATPANGQAQEPFYSFLSDGSSMTYSATTGNITLTCSRAFFTPAMVNVSRLSIAGQQVVITGYISPTQATALVPYRLPDGINIQVVDGTRFSVGQIVQAAQQQFKFVVNAVVGNSVQGILLTPVLFNNTWVVNPDGTHPDILVSSYGSSPFVAVNFGATLSTIAWQEEFMSAIRGWPQSCFYDRGRVGFCDFPQKPEAVLWGAINGPSNFWIDSQAAANNPEAGAAADAAILEFIPGQANQGPPRVRHVVGWGDEFVFTDRGIYQIPISSSGNPLKPGSVEFRQISNDGVAPIRPVLSQDTIVYMNAGLTRCCAIKATGTYTRPYISEDMSEDHSDLFNSPVAFTVVAGDGQFPERYVYILNSDGSMVVGKFTADRKFGGWSPWSSAGTVKWVASVGSNVYFNTIYGSTPLLEIEDNTQILDMAVTINNIPAGLLNYGPLWWYSSRTITLMDGNRDLGDRMTDPTGNIVPLPGDDLSSPTLTAGVYVQPKWEPFIPGAQPGDNIGQRQKRRKIKRAMVNVEKSSGFTLGNKQFPANYQNEDPTAQPVLRDGAFFTRPAGRSYDPTITLIKDRPGPLRLCEFSVEVTI